MHYGSGYAETQAFTLRGGLQATGSVVLVELLTSGPCWLLRRVREETHAARWPAKALRTQEPNTRGDRRLLAVSKVKYSIYAALSLKLYLITVRERQCSVETGEPHWPAGLLPRTGCACHRASAAWSLKTQE